MEWIEDTAISAVWNGKMMKGRNNLAILNNWA